MSDFPTLDRNYGDEVIVVVQARAKHRTLHRIFEDNDARILKLVNDQFIGLRKAIMLP